MKAITTKYFGPTNTRGSKFKAFDCDKNSVTLSYDYSLNSEGNHRKAAIALAEKMNWHGTLMGGHIDKGMVWVFVENDQTVAV
jgi:hypothetical protein